MVDYGPQAPMNTTTVATAVQRRWACHTRTVLPADAYWRQGCNVVLSACFIVYLRYMSCALCARERGQQKQTNFTGTYVPYKIGLTQRKPGNRTVSGKTFESLSRELQCSDRAQTSTTGSGRPSCVDVVLGFSLKVLVRRDKVPKQTKNSQIYVYILYQESVEAL